MTKRGTQRVTNGFTLVELMIVVAIIGVLAALAIYGVSRYLKHAKTAEATRNISAIEKGDYAAYQLDTDTGGAGSGPYVHQFCVPGFAAGARPSTVPAGSKVSTAGTWTTPNWVCLKFSINEPHFYQYNNGGGGTGTAAVYQVEARGDLDGNGTTSDFLINGVGSATGDAQRTSFQITNEDE